MSEIIKRIREIDADLDQIGFYTTTMIIDGFVIAAFMAALLLWAGITTGDI